MKSTMIKTACFSLVCVVALLTVFFKAPRECYGFEISIDVAPNTLNLQSEGHVVTVHTDIAYVQVAGYTVVLNQVAINSWKADNRGYFVAKFLMSEIKALPLVPDDYNTLSLVGFTTDNEEFLGQQDIMVVDNVPAGGP